jgi:hypothetical protein
VQLFRVEGSNFVHEQDIMCDMIPGCDLLPQMYGDHLVFQQNIDESARYLFYSLSKNTVVATIEFPACQSVEELSTLHPIIYTCCQDSNDEYTIYAIACTLQTACELYTGTINVCVDDAGHGVASMKLYENEQGKYLRIFQDGVESNSIEIYDVNKEAMVFSKRYSEVDRDGEIPPKELLYYHDAWRDMSYNVGTPYYCTTSGKFSDFP